MLRMDNLYYLCFYTLNIIETFFKVLTLQRWKFDNNVKQGSQKQHPKF